ncbi:hypothetical protein pb186bvf_003236 [Paramecium bursaria]
MDQTTDAQIQENYLQSAEYQANLLTLYNLMRDLNDENFEKSLNNFITIHNGNDLLIQEICNQPINWFYRTKHKKYINFLNKLCRNIELEDNLTIKIKHDFQAKRQECLDLISVFEIPQELKQQILSRVLCDILISYRYDQASYSDNHQKVQKISNLFDGCTIQIEIIDQILNFEQQINLIITLDLNQIACFLNKIVGCYVPPKNMNASDDDIKLELLGCLNQKQELSHYLLNKLVLIRPKLCQWLYETILQQLLEGHKAGYDFLQTLCNNDELKKKHKISFRDVINKEFTKTIQKYIRTLTVERLSQIFIELSYRNLLIQGTKSSLLQLLVKEYLIDKDNSIKQALQNLIWRYDNPAYLDIQEAINFNTIKFIIM